VHRSVLVIHAELVMSPALIDSAIADPKVPLSSKG
jgi:hypothetical protein